jgi:hypothetical protein
MGARVGSVRPESFTHSCHVRAGEDARLSIIMGRHCRM